MYSDNRSHNSDATHNPGDPLIHLRDLFYIVVDLPQSERQAWLAANVSDAIQRNTLRELLAAHETHGFLETSAIELDSRIIAAEVKPEGLIGQQIGEFRISRALGQGGMAAVFLGERVGKDFTQRAAVKLLRRGLYSELEQRLFLRERQVLAALDHPHIARLIDGGVTGAGIPYLVMEYIDGVPITQYASERNLSIRERLQLFAQVCEAVQAAHNNLIVHRDIKPSNILVTASGEVKLLDFGIAKLLEDDIEGVTGTAGIFTPDYAAPEQIHGGVITTATDVYGLGVLLHELLTGLRPSGTPTKRPSSLLDATTAPIHPQAPRTYPMSATQLRKILRGDVDNIVLHALEAEPHRRYASAGAFAEDIARYLDGRPIRAHPPTRWYKTRKFVQRHRGGVMVTAILVLAIFAALGLALWQTKVAQQQADVARTQSNRAEAVQSFLIDIFRANTVDQPDPLKARQTSARELLDIGAKKIDRAMSDAPEAKFYVLSLFGTLHNDLRLSDDAAREHRQAADLARTLWGNNATQLADELVKLSGSMAGGSDTNEMESVLREAERILDHNGDLTSDTRGKLLDHLASYYSNYDLPRALDYARQSVRVLEAQPASGNLIAALTQQGLIENSLGAPQDAIASYQRALEMSNAKGNESIASSIRPDVMKTYAYLTDVQYRVMDIPAAERSARRALEMATSISGSESVDVFQTQMRLGRLLDNTSRTSEGLALLATAKQLATKIDKTSDRGMASVLTLSGKAQIDAGSLKEGLTDLESAVALTRRISPASDILAARLEIQSTALIDLGRSEQALQCLDEAAHIREKNKQHKGMDSFNSNVEIRAQLELMQNGAAPSGVKEMLASILVDDQVSKGISFDRIEHDLLLARLELDEKRTSDAIETVVHVRQLIEANNLSVYLKPYSARADLIEGLADLQERRAQAAIPWLQQALALRQEILLPHSPKIAEAQIALAEGYLALHDIARARVLASDASNVQAAQSELSDYYREPLRRLLTALSDK